MGHSIFPYPSFSPVQIIPTELRESWQADLESLNERLGGTVDTPISSLLIMLETPEEMVVLCTTGVLIVVPV